MAVRTAEVWLCKKILKIRWSDRKTSNEVIERMALVRQLESAIVKTVKIFWS